MARSPLGFIGRVKGGPARGGLGRELRFYTADDLAVAKDVFRREAGANLQPVPIVPNAGVPRALAADRAAGDAFVTVAIGHTGSYNVGDLIPIWNPTQGTVYRVITLITPATGRLDLDSALGIAFTVANGTLVNATDMEGHVHGWVDDATHTWVQVKELGSNRLLAPVKVAAAAPALVIAIQEEGVAVNSRATLNFIGPNLTATDDPGNNRVNVTDTAAPRAATYVVGSADATLTAELVLGTAVIMEGTLGTRPAASLGGRLYVTTDEAGGRRVYRDTGSAWNQVAHGIGQLITAAMFDDTAHGVRAVANAHGMAQISGTISDAQHGARTVANAHQYSQIGGYPALTTASADLGSNVNLNQNSYTDIVSVSLAAGTWLVLAHATIDQTNSGDENSMRISDGTTHWASTEMRANASSSIDSMSCSAIITLGSTTTVKLQATRVSASVEVAYAAVPHNATGNHATGIRAVRLA